MKRLIAILIATLTLLAGGFGRTKEPEKQPQEQFPDVIEITYTEDTAGANEKAETERGGDPVGLKAEKEKDMAATETEVTTTETEIVPINEIPDTAESTADPTATQPGTPTPSFQLTVPEEISRRI